MNPELGTRNPKPPLSQHFTPLPVVDLAYDLLHSLHGPLVAPRLIDPACGEGIFLHRAVERGLAPPDHVFGLERDAGLAVRCFGRAGSPRVAVADAFLGLRAPRVEGPFDLVVANPPYGTGSGGLRGFDEPAAAHVAACYRFVGGRAERVRRYPAEVLFLELCLALARPGGHVAIVLPEGVLANTRYRYVREWLLGGFQVDAVVSLPVDTFHRTGAAAKTALLLVTKCCPPAGHHVRLGEVGEWGEEDRGPRTEDRGPAARRERQGDASTALGGDALAHLQSDPRLLDRLDPQYWRPECEALLATCRLPLLPLGGFVAKLTYGPIVTAQPLPEIREGIPIVNQGQVHFCGVDLSAAPLAPPDSPWVSPRSMLQSGDVVLPRSGEGSLGRHKVAVFLGEQPATVGSFVDLIRLRGLSPFYLAAFLKSRLGKAQVARVANGVGVPNISFEEIRGLRVPALSPAGQQALERRYREEVLPCHREAVARHAALRRQGLPTRREAGLVELWEAGQGRWQRVIDDLDAELLG